MKITDKIVQSIALALVTTMASVGLGAESATAFDLIKKGNHSLGESSRDKVLQIRSEKSIDSLTPGVWYVVYADPDAEGKAVEIKFGGGQKLEVTRPNHIEGLAKGSEPFLNEKLKIDSDRALEIAGKEPLAQKAILKVSRLVLEKRSSEDTMPVWRVRLWASKAKNPNRNVDIGEVVISADEGKVLKSDLNPDRVN